MPLGSLVVGVDVGVGVGVVEPEVEVESDVGAVDVGGVSGVDIDVEGDDSTVDETI